MAIQEIVQSGKSFRLCIDNTPNNKKWLTIFFKGLAKDIEMNDGTTVQQKLGNFKGTTTNENQVAGYAADVTLVKSIKTSLTSLITSLTNLVNSINSRLGGLRFYEDSTGKYVVGADSVPKKLGNTRANGSANASILLNYQYLTTRNAGVVFGKDDSKEINITYQNYDNSYEALFQVDGSNDLKNWTQISQKGLPPIKSGQNVVEATYDINLSGYKYFHIRNTHIADARMIINSVIV